MSLIDHWCLITGASSGIGRACALELSKTYLKLLLAGRRLEKLIEVKDEIKLINSNCEVQLLHSDVRDQSFLENIDNFNIKTFINNAGIALGKDSIALSQENDWQEMMDVNFQSGIRLIKRILPHMLKEQEGDIINLGSVAGIEMYSGGGVYCASKHALRAFTKILREETCGQNIRVMMVSPGMVHTEFSLVRFKGNKKMADDVYDGMTPLFAQDIASQIAFMLSRPRHVTIDEIITMPTDQGSVHKVKKK